MRAMLMEIAVAVAFALMLVSVLRVEPATEPGRVSEAIAALQVVTPAVETAAAPQSPPVAADADMEPELAELPDLGFPYPAARIERVS